MPNFKFLASLVPDMWSGYKNSRSRLCDPSQSLWPNFEFFR